MIKKIKISFPHATESFWICCDNEKLASLLEIYYGSMMEYVEKTGVIVLCYIDDTFFIKEDSCKYNIQKRPLEIAFCNIVAYIRHNVCLEKDWFFYHAVSVARPDGRVLMMDRIHWQNDWPFVEGGTSSLSAEKPIFN